MDKITEIVKGLKPHDINLITKIYGAKVLKDGNKRLKLLNLVLNQQVYSDEEASLILYNKKPHPAFVKLKQRLRDDIFNFILMQDADKLYEAPKARHTFDCRRKILTGEFLMGRGLMDIGIKRIKKALKIAEKYELFWESLQIRIILRNKVGHSQNYKSYDKYSQDIQSDMEKFQAYIKAEELYIKILLPNIWSFKMDSDYKDYGKKLLEEFESLNLETETTQFLFCIGAYYYYFKIQDFYNCLEINQKLEKLVQKGRIYYNRPFRAKCLNSYAEIYIHLKQLDMAIPYARESLGLLNPKKNNWHNAALTCFYACFYGGELEEAESLYQKSANSKIIQKNSLRAGYWNYFKAILEFKKGDLQESRKFLHSMGKLPNTDPAGWLLGYKLLELMIFILEEEYELMAVYLRNLNQILNRHKLETDGRIVKIIKIIRIHNKSPFDKIRTLKKITPDMKLLQDDKGPYKWNPMGYELIRFDEWFLKSVLKLKEIK